MISVVNFTQHNAWVLKGFLPIFFFKGNCLFLALAACSLEAEEVEPDGHLHCGWVGFEGRYTCPRDQGWGLRLRQALMR